MKIDFAELGGWQEFEDLTADYFRDVKSDEANNLIDVEVEPSGDGPDGGRDILLTFRIDDSIVTFNRKWIVQCKFYENNLLKGSLSDVNIPTLIQEYDADGYLLIVKNNVSSGVTSMFENLRKKCKNGFEYRIWNGSHFRAKLAFALESLHKTYFPQYYEFNREQEAKLESLRAGYE